MARTWEIIIIGLVAAFLVGILAGAPVKADDSELQHGMGCLLSPPGDYPALDAPPVHTQALPSVLDLSSNLPPVADQGAEPTCTLWAVAYYYKTFQERRERAWDINNTSHQFSPSFLYSLSTSCSQLQPIAIPTALELVKYQGCATLATFPLLTFDQCRLPTTEELQAALPYRALSYGYLFMRPGNADIYRLKAHLAKGDPFVLSVPVYDSFYFYKGEPPVIGLPKASEKLWGYHAVLIVGYDDSLGAFKLVNSWGTRWGLGGYAYLSYGFVQYKAWEAWAMVDAVSVTPTPTATPTVTATTEPTVTATPVSNPTATPTPTALPSTTPTPLPSPTSTVYTLLLQQGLKGFGGVTDTYIESGQPTKNYGLSRALKVNDDGSASALLRFDLSGVPVGVEIVEAILELYITVDTPGQNLTLASFEVRRPWVNKEVDWRKASREQLWGVSGCKDTMSDRAAIPVSTQTIAPGKGWCAIDVTEAVRHWVSGQMSNNGLLLQGQGMTKASYIFLSSEHWSTDMRPKLTVKYINKAE